MSCEVSILQNGYSRWHEKPCSMYANGTSSLVRNGSQVIIVDTLGPWDRDKLLEYLNKYGLEPGQVSTVVATHQHTDHTGNLNLFTDAVQIVGNQRCKGDFFEFDIFGDRKHLGLAPSVELLFTPGHTHNDTTVLVRNVDKLGTVAITGDLFESHNDLNNDNIWIEAGSVNHAAQRSNRQYILSIADYIIPGHGEMFKVN